MAKTRAARRSGLLVCLLAFVGGALQAAGTAPPRAKQSPAVDAEAAATRGPAAPAWPALAILDWAPQGKVRSWHEPASQQIRVRFNRPVVALGEPGMLEAKDLLAIEPPIAGRTVWQSPELLVFTPDKPLLGSNGRPGETPRKTPSRSWP